MTWKRRSAFGCLTVVFAFIAYRVICEQARERNFDEWQHRPLWHQLVDGLAYLAHGQL